MYGVKKDGKYSFLSAKGEFVCKEWFDEIKGDFYDNCIIVKYKEKYNLLTLVGNLLFKKGFDNIRVNPFEGVERDNSAFEVKIKNEWFKLRNDGLLFPNFYKMPTYESYKILISNLSKLIRPLIGKNRNRDDILSIYDTVLRQNGFHRDRSSYNIIYYCTGPDDNMVRYRLQLWPDKNGEWYLKIPDKD